MNPLTLDVSPGPSDDNGYYTRHPSRQTSHESYNSSDNNDSTPTALSTLSSSNYKIVGEQDIEFPPFNHASAYLGHGTYGTVIEVKYKHMKAALKILASDSSSKAFCNTEAQLLHGVQHENIINLYAVYKSDQQTGLLLELMPGGSLHQLLHKHQQVRYYADHALGWAHQCASALTYLHKHGYLHRDLKPSNMLLSDSFIDLKLCDFGTAAKLKTLMTNNCGSAAYMAPEVFKHNKYDQKCDMYSFGISLWEIITRRYPVDANETNNLRVLWQTTMENRRPPLCTNIPNPLKEIMEQCWHQDPNYRPEAEEVLKCLEILMEFYGNRFKPLIDLTTKKQAFASKLHEKFHSNYSAPADLDNLSRENEASPKAITPSAPFAEAFQRENQRRQAPPVPPRPNFESVTGHRRGRSQDFGPCDVAHARFPSGNSSQSSINLLPTPPPYSQYSPQTSSTSSGMPYSPCLQNTSPSIPPPHQPHPLIGFNPNPLQSRNSSIPNCPPYPAPTHLAAPTGPSEIGWRRASEPPNDFGVPMGSGYSSPNDCNNTSPSGSEAHRPKKKHSGIKKFFKDFTKPQ